MTELLTAAQMRVIEQNAIQSGEVTGLELMERAGQGVVDAVFEEWPELGQGTHRAVVLCGPGNNGGDGFVIARLLKERGWAVEVFLYGDPEKLPPDAKTNCERWAKIGESRPLDLVGNGDFDCLFSGVLVDALFGTGLGRPFEPSQHFLDHFETFSDPGMTAEAKVVSVDIPSGLCADSGKPVGDALFSNLTVSFHRRKLGHVLGEGPWRCQKCVVADIGLNNGSYTSMGKIGWGRFARETSAFSGPDKRNRPWRDHKYSHGHALILSGGSGKTGAARLAARGALRIGAGLVTLGVPGSAKMEVASQITTLMLQRVDDAEGLSKTLKDHRLNALCLGPGMGIERARDLVPAALKARHEPSVVLDADALTAYQDAPQALFDILHKNCVLTPHTGEFSRLFPDLAQRLCEAPISGPAYSKVDATREAAKRAGCTILFKGPDTVIADPEGRCSVNAAVYEREAPWLATAGSGDVLAGFITGMLARGFLPMLAAETAAWLHVDCARAFGPGLIAEDLPEILPQVLRALEI